MKSNLLPKNILSPFLGVVFIAVAATGGLMFFHVKNGLIVHSHEWLGMIFLIAGLLHMLLHIRGMVAYLKQPKGIVAAVVGLVLVVLFMIIGAGSTNGAGHRGPGNAPQQAQP